MPAELHLHLSLRNPSSSIGSTMRGSGILLITDRQWFMPFSWAASWQAARTLSQRLSCEVDALRYVVRSIVAVAMGLILLYAADPPAEEQDAVVAFFLIPIQPFPFPL
jgi:hypothetical protein